MGSDVNKSKPSGPVIIGNGKVSIDAENVILYPEVIVSKDGDMLISNSHR